MCGEAIKQAPDFSQNNTVEEQDWVWPGGTPGCPPYPAPAPPLQWEAELCHAPGFSLIESPSSGCKGHHREELLKKREMSRLETFFRNNSVCLFGDRLAQPC